MLILRGVFEGISMPLGTLCNSREVSGISKGIWTRGGMTSRILVHMALRGFSLNPARLSGGLTSHWQMSRDPALAAGIPLVFGGDASSSEPFAESFQKPSGAGLVEKTHG